MNTNEYGEYKPAAGLPRLGGQPLPLISPARVYICGITPYDVTHLGHAATFVWADAAASIMRLLGADVVTCRNVTDIDDVLTQAAAERSRRYDELAVTQEHLFDRDMAMLRVRRPTHTPRAHRYVSRVIELAAALLTNDAAYERDGQVYFRGELLGELATQRGASAAEHGELDEDPGREHPTDVAVWRRSGDGDPAWPSPWGPGRPGWHAECAAIAVSVLGPAVDLVVGGADLAFPHHAYQAAIARAATGVAPFSRARLSIGTVTVAGAKMAKSAGNLVLVGDLLAKHDPAALRLLLLDRDWRVAWEYREEALASAAARLDRLYTAAGRPTEKDSARTAVITALGTELDIPRALDIAEESGGDAARLVLRTLSLA